jgi:hypothetical protein
MGREERLKAMRASQRRLALTGVITTGFAMALVATLQIWMWLR